MKFFTRDWCQGKMTDEEAEAVILRYQRHLDKLDLPASIRELASLNPHDACILDAQHEPREGTLRLRLRCGDLQIGYFDATLTFTQAGLTSVDAATLARARYPAKFDIIYDEVDKVAGDAFEYRLLLHPTGEVLIGFKHVTIVRRPVADREAE
ncbi:MAG TPA: hypothetical protein VK157_12400 [Phycisphaerales bacterium]|nr:hypothetical protein [Phycisphaerales bacterium]